MPLVPKCMGFLVGNPLRGMPLVSESMGFLVGNPLRGMPLVPECWGFLVGKPRGGMPLVPECKGFLIGNPWAREAIVFFPESMDFILLSRYHDAMASSDTICPRSSYQFYIVTHYIKWVTEQTV